MGNLQRCRETVGNIGQLQGKKKKSFPGGKGAEHPTMLDRACFYCGCSAEVERPASDWEVAGSVSALP